MYTISDKLKAINKLEKFKKKGLSPKDFASFEEYLKAVAKLQGVKAKIY